MTPEEIRATINAMPLDEPERERLLEAALAGERLDLMIVQLHAWRQAQPDRPGRRWFDRLWRQIWHR